MPSYKIGLDFGTHQTKICLEDSSDRRNKRYFFHRFADGEGQEHYTLPSVVMVKKDRTLAYGYVDEEQALQTQITPLTEEPSKPNLVLWPYPPEPKLPDLPVLGEAPQKPDYDEILMRRPRPEMPQPPEVQSQDSAEPMPQVFHDLSDLGSILEDQQEIKSKSKSFGELMVEYQKAKQCYEIELKKYNRWLEKEKFKVDYVYAEQMRHYREQLDHYKSVEAMREKMMKSYEDKCRDVDIHNENCKRQMSQRVADYEKALKLWNEERETPHPIVMRYFKQAIFSSGLVWRYEWSPMLVSIWYLTFVFFDLDEKYGTENLIVCMGASSGTKTWQKNKEMATQVILSVYHLIEDVFHHDRQAFLSCTVDDLVKLTTIEPYSNDAIFVFPEAYANLNPMAVSGKFGNGMNMVIDIGGGTTDISLFSAPHGEEVMIYDYVSIPYGLNAVEDIGVDGYKSAVSRDMSNIVRRIESHARFIGIPEHEISRVLQKRPIVYTGGGSTRSVLCCGYAGFNDIKHVRDNVGVNILIEDRLEVFRLMAILSTALGLAMCKEKKGDEIKLQSLRELFKNVEEAYNEKRHGDSNDRYEHGHSDWD